MSITRDWATGTLKDLYRLQVETEQRLKEEARDQAQINIIGHAIKNDWSVEELIEVLDLLDLNYGWVADKINETQAS